MSEQRPATLPRALVAAAPSSAKMAATIKTAEAQLDLLKKELHKARLDPIKLAMAFVCLRKLKDRVESFNKQFEAVLGEYKADIVPNAFQAAGITNVPLAEGFRVGYSTKIFCSIREGMSNDAFQWLRKNKLGDLVKPTVNAQSLSAAALYRIEEQNLDMPDTLFRTYPVLNTSVTAISRKGE